MSDYSPPEWDPSEQGDAGNTSSGKRRWLDNAPAWAIPVVTAVPALIIGAIAGALIFGGDIKPPSNGTELASAQTRVAELEEELAELIAQHELDVEEALQEREDEFAERERHIEERTLALDALKKKLDEQAASQEDEQPDNEDGAWTPPEDLVGPPKKAPTYTPPPAPDISTKPRPAPGPGPTPAPPATSAPAPTQEPEKPAGPKPWSSFRAGVYEVGKDIKPGKYRTEEAIGFQMCYWAIYERGTNRTVVIDNDLASSGRPVVTVKVGQEFETTGCGTWKKQ